MSVSQPPKLQVVIVMVHFTAFIVKAGVIVMHAGGMLPLSATLATNSIFEAFQHDSKLKALLHGHSYTAHAIGCSAAVTALDLYTDPTCNPNLREPDQQTASLSLVELWDEQLVNQLSRHARVQKLTVLGRVPNACAICEGHAAMVPPCD